MDDRVQRVHEQIDRDRLRRHSNRVLHGHPSPTLWDEPDVPVDEILKWRRHPRSGPRKDLLLYVGIPFCLPTTPDRCGFCLFPSEVYKGPDQLVTYLRYLRAEGELYQGWFDDDEVRAVYFGGGTANLCAPEQYQELMDIVRAVCPLAADVEVTVEGVAQLFTAAKLERMREAGVTRVSLGVQQLDPELLALSGRKQNATHVLAMVWRCRYIEITNARATPSSGRRRPTRSWPASHDFVIESATQDPSSATGRVSICAEQCFSSEDPPGQPGGSFSPPPRTS